MNTTDFPIENLPFGVFDADGEPHVCTAIEDNILDLHGWLPEPALNAFMASGDVVETKQRIRKLLDTNAELIPMRDATMLMPVRIGDYTDFYASIHHATRVGAKFRPDNPLLPNYKWVPIGYHGRSSSLCASGHSFHRPRGQIKGDAPEPQFAPTRRLDYELEVGAVVGRGNELGEPIPMANAEQHLFGIVLLNDWTARDIQPWEYQPLGPFLSKNFATTLSPWVVTLEALAPFRAPLARPAEDPPLVPYLDSAQARSSGAIDIQLEVLISTQQMEERGQA